MGSSTIAGGAAVECVSLASDKMVVAVVSHSSSVPGAQELHKNWGEHGRDYTRGRLDVGDDDGIVNPGFFGICLDVNGKMMPVPTIGAVAGNEFVVSVLLCIAWWEMSENQGLEFGPRLTGWVVSWQEGKPRAQLASEATRGREKEARVVSQTRELLVMGVEKRLDRRKSIFESVRVGGIQPGLVTQKSDNQVDRVVR